MGDIVPFEQAARPPAAAAQYRGTLNDIVQEGVAASFGVVSYKGRTWKVKFRGEEHMLKGENGAPMQHLDVVVVNGSPSMSKVFYLSGYVEGQSEGRAPDCFSIDGKTPDPAAPHKQHPTCATCPKNMFGSAATAANPERKGKACQDSRRLAVAPLNDMDGEIGPLLLRVPPASLKNLANYGKYLKAKGADMEHVATRVSFDWNVAYPLLQFQALGWLDDERAARSIELRDDERVQAMLHDVVDEVKADPAAETPDPLAGGGPAKVFQQPVQAAVDPTPTPAPAPVPTPTPVERLRQNVIAPRVEAANKAAAAPAPVAPAPEATVVQAAPSDMQKAIDDLLNMPAA